MLHCEQCTLNPRRLKKQWDICDCTVQYGYWNKHIQSKKHRLRSYVEQLNSTYQDEYLNCFICHLFFQQFDPLNEYIFVKCLTGSNIPKMHCGVCRHIKSKKHLNNMTS
jgi:hypothetical protein